MESGLRPSIIVQHVKLCVIRVGVEEDIVWSIVMQSVRVMVMVTGCAD